MSNYIFCFSLTVKEKANIIYEESRKHIFTTRQRNFKIYYFSSRQTNAMKYNITHNIEPRQIEQDIFSTVKLFQSLALKIISYVYVCLHILLDKYFYACVVEILINKKLISNVYGD